MSETKTPLPFGKKIASGIIQLLMVVFGIALIVSYFWAAVWLLRGGVWAFNRFYPVMQEINAWIFLVLLLLLASSIFKRMRPIAGAGLAWGSYLLTATFWLYCLYVTYSHWGMTGVVVGVLLMGFGVFATACLSLLFAGQFSDLFYVVLILAVIYGFRAMGVWLIKKHDDRLRREKEEQARILISLSRS